MRRSRARQSATEPRVARPEESKGFLWGAVLAGIVASAGSDAWADLVPGYPDDMLVFDTREIAMLPRYCIHTQTFRDRVPGGNNKAEIRRLEQTLGPTYLAVHHYCLGLMKTNRAVFLAREPRIKNFYLSDSISEFDYVIDRAPADFVLLPEILTKKGENLIRLGQAPLAIRELQRAIDLKPDYWPPYAVLSDYYKDHGDRAKARETLEKALSAAPGAKAISRRMKELDEPGSAQGRRPSAP
jgi:hypothetical protein